RPPVQSYPGRDQALSEFARHANVGESVAAEAVRQLGELNRQALTQAETVRKGGPDNFLQQYFERQQVEWQRQRTEERERDLERRREEEDKWQRRQDDDQKRHERDLERIKREADGAALREKEQRQTLLE